MGVTSKSIGTAASDASEGFENFSRMPSIGSAAMFGKGLANRFVDPAHVEILDRWIEMRNGYETDRNEWAKIMDERCMYVLPSTVYRQQAGQFDGQGLVKVNYPTTHARPHYTRPTTQPLNHPTHHPSPTTHHPPPP